MKKVIFMKKKYELLFVIFYFTVAIKLHSSEYSEDFTYIYDKENSAIGNNVKYWDIQIIQSNFFPNSNIDENLSHSQQDNNSDESNSVVVWDSFLPENDNNSNSNPLDHYAQFFTNEWITKKIIAQDMQDQRLGMLWHKSISTPSNPLNHFINNKGTTGINIQTNLSILRIISNLVKEYLDQNKLDDLKNLLTQCQEHKIHWWTSPYIEKKTGQIHSENMIRVAFEDRRQRLFLSIQEAMHSFCKNKEILFADLIRKMQVLYTLASMTHTIHTEKYSCYETHFIPLENIRESDILFHVTILKKRTQFGSNKQKNHIKKNKTNNC